MRLCVSIPCFFPKTDFSEAVKLVKSLGYDAVETWGWENLDLEKVKQTLDETGVEFTDMCTTEFRMTDPAYRALWLEGLEKSCQAAAYLGVGKLITQVGPDTGAPREEQHAAIVETLRLAGPILEKYGVTVMIEPLNTYVDHKGYYLTTAKEGAQIVREVGHPLVKMVFDIYHQSIMEGNIIPNITENLDTIVHLHGAGHPGRHEMWEGETDYRNVFKAAEKAGYEGICGMEFFPTGDPVETLKKALEIYG